MLVVQHNYGQGYQSIVMALKTELSIKAGIIMVRNLLISNQEIYHSRFNFYWPQDDRKNIKVMMAIRKNLMDKIVINHRTDLGNHLYFILLEIRELNLQFERPEKKS